MATATANTQTPLTDDVVRRGVPRELQCKLDDVELLRIARTRTNKEAERDQLLADMALETAKRKAQIKDLEDEIGKMGRELRTGEQERTVKCNEVFRKHEDGTGWIYTIRLDTFDEVERKPATAHETQRYLPSFDASGGGGLLAQATAAPRSAQDEAAPAPESDGEDVPSDDEDGDDQDDDAKKPQGRSRKTKAK